MSEEETEEKQDSYTVGTAATTGAIKIYFDFKTLSDEEAKKLISQANGLYKYAAGLGK